MPAWLVWYSGMYVEVKLFFGILAVLLFFFTLCSATDVGKKISNGTILLYILGCLTLISLAFLLPDGRTAISMYNAF